MSASTVQRLIGNQAQRQEFRPIGPVPNAPGWNAYESPDIGQDGTTVEAIRVWDVIEEAWVKPMPPHMVEPLVSRTLLMCSACDRNHVFTGDTVNAVKNHVEKTLEECERHKDAEMVPVSTSLRGSTVSGLRCTGCGFEFYGSPQDKAKWHLTRYNKQVGEAHRNASAVLLHRYARQERDADIMATYAITVGPADIQVEGSRTNDSGDGRKKRSRHRKRSR